ncbi:MAG: hypothetical protein SFX73_21375 [Kofleriaceae bacterium]|nr:hypothetical protein [Kofleriaceae bacterium]
MLRSLVFLVAAGCAGPSTIAAAPAPPVPTETVPGALDSVGAVPLPAPNASGIPLNEIDTTVVLEALPNHHAAWTERRTAAYSGRVLVALAIGHDTATTEGIYLYVVETELRDDSDHRGIVERWRISTIDRAASRPDDDRNAFTPYYFRDDNGDDHAPLKFAVRFLPRVNAHEAERTQLAIYTLGTSVLVAEKRVSASTWTARLRVDMPRATEIVPVMPGWH